MAQIRTLVVPQYLYRYRSLRSEVCSRELRAIQLKQLWCSNFDCLNDPMEGAYEASPMVSKDPQVNTIRGRIFGQKMALGICSFSETFDNELMWAHYADKFKGVCIEYFFPNLLVALGDNVDFVRMSYSEQSPKVFPRSTDDGEIAKKILSTKSHRWLYEREWRLFSPNVGALTLPQDWISCVYLGNRMSDKVKTNVMRVLDERGLKSKIMAVDGYSIKFSTSGRKKQLASRKGV